MIQNKPFLSHTMNERFIELCDEFLKDFFESRPNLDELKKEWTYFKILLNNRNLEKSQISDYFSILKEKIIFHKNYQVPEMPTRPNFMEKDYKVAYNMKKEENQNCNVNVMNMNKNSSNGNYSNQIFELLKKNNAEVDKYVFKDRKLIISKEYEDGNINDFIEEITQKYR